MKFSQKIAKYNTLVLCTWLILSFFYKNSNRTVAPCEGETATIDAYIIEISWAMYYLSMSIIGLVLAISTDTVCQ